MLTVFIACAIGATLMGLLLIVCYFLLVFMDEVIHDDTIKKGDYVIFEDKKWRVIEFDLYTKDPVIARDNSIRCPSIDKVTKC